jgi:hypothetical protein
MPVKLKIRANEILQQAGQEIDATEHSTLVAKRDKRDPNELALPGDEYALDLIEWTEGDFDRLTAEVFITRTVDNLLTYLTEILIEIHKRRPETLRSGAQVTLRDVLAHDSMDSFVSWAAEDRVSALSRRGFRQLADEIGDRLKLSLAESRDKIDSVALRNVLVHQRGRIDRRFLALVGTDSFGQLGGQLDLDAVQRSGGLAHSIEIVRKFDRQVAEKFGLEVARLKPRKSWTDIAFVGEPRSDSADIDPLY